MGPFPETTIDPPRVIPPSPPSYNILYLFSHISKRTDFGEQKYINVTCRSQFCVSIGTPSFIGLEAAWLTGSLWERQTRSLELVPTLFTKIVCGKHRLDFIEQEQHLVTSYLTNCSDGNSGVKKLA